MTKPGSVQSLNINDLKRYAPEARVNQPLLSSNDLVTRMNCYEPGQATPMHVHPDDDEVIFCVEGRGAITFADRDDLPISPGSLVSLPAGLAHGIEAAAEFGLATGEVAVDRNPSGGHVDYRGSLGLQLHAVRYANVRGLTSLYYGGGATFALHSFSVIRPQSRRTSDTRTSMWTGGLDVDGVLGCEFIRASMLSFYVQGEVNLPAYAASNETDAGAVNTWFPGAALKLGAIF